MTINKEEWTGHWGYCAEGHVYPHPEDHLHREHGQTWGPFVSEDFTLRFKEYVQRMDSGRSGVET